MSSEIVEPFRIAFRSEGDFVNCYYAAPDTMEGAMLLSSFRTSTLRQTQGAFAKWRELMQQIMNAACLGALGAEPVGFETRAAPEHERSGSA